MSNKLEITAYIDFRPEERAEIQTGQLYFMVEPATKDYMRGIQNIGIVEEALLIGDVASIGYVMIINRDKTNYIEIGLTASYSVKILPGQFAMFQPDGVLYGKANVAACDIEYFVFPSA